MKPRLRVVALGGFIAGVTALTGGLFTSGLAGGLPAFELLTKIGATGAAAGGSDYLGQGLLCLYNYDRQCSISSAGVVGALALGGLQGGLAGEAAKSTFIFSVINAVGSQILSRHWVPSDDVIASPFEILRQQIRAKLAR